MLNNTFIISAQNTWAHTNPSQAQQLAKELSKQHKILYVNPPTALGCKQKCDDKNKTRNTKDNVLKQLDDNIWLLNPPMIKNMESEQNPKSINDYINKLSTSQYAKIINWASDSLSFRNSILICEDDLVVNYQLNKLINPWLSILFYNNPPHNEAVNIRGIKASDIVITGSQFLAQKIRAINFNTFNIGYGIDFSKQDQSQDIEELFDNIPLPRIGVITELNSCELSLDIINNIALNFPLCSLVLAGKMDYAFRNHPLTKLPNVFCIDQMDYSLTQHMNVCVSPQNFHSLSLTQGKEAIINYLSYGKSVISTSTLAANDLSPYIYLASNQAHLFELIKASLEEKLAQKTIDSRIKYAQNMSWEVCTSRIYSIIEMYENQLRENYSKINEQKSLV